jgi:hypothetical protein
VSLPVRVVATHDEDELTDETIEEETDEGVCELTTGVFPLGAVFGYCVVEGAAVVTTTGAVDVSSVDDGAIMEWE